MSGYGFGKCRLCSAVDDYCMMTTATGIELDCRQVIAAMDKKKLKDLESYVSNVEDWTREAGE